MTQAEPEPGDEITPPPAIDPAIHADLVLENALLKAGVDTESEQGKIVRAAWEGKSPDGDAIKRQWELVKPVAATPEPEPEPDPRIEGEERQGEERRALNASAVVEPNPMDENPRHKAVDAALAVMAPEPGRGPAGTRDDAIATGVHHILESAASGDSRVLVVDEPGSSER